MRWLLTSMMLIRATRGFFAPDDDRDDSLDELSNNANLVADIQRHYQAPSVFMIYANDESLRMMKLMSNLMLEFSNAFVPALTMNFTDLKHHRDLYRSRIVRPLFVAFLSSTKEVQTFARMSREYEMSYALWLILFTEPMHDLCLKPKDNFFNVAFDTEMLVKCYGDPVIREWYSLYPNRMNIVEFATWNPTTRLQLMVLKGLYERRNNLEGIDLRIATVKDVPSDFFKNILEEMSLLLNFTMKEAHQDEFYGTYDEVSGKWSGVIGRLTAGEADLGMGEFTMTRERLDVIDFTQPIMQSRNFLYLRKPDGSVLQWSAYFRVYTTEVWLAINFMYLLSGLIITLMRVTIKENDIPPNHVSENYLFVWGIYCQQGLPEFPNASPMRIAYFSVLIKAVVLLATYSACLISYLTVTNPSLPFTDMRGFANDGSYKLIVLRESADFDIYDNSTDDVINKMSKQMPDPRTLPKTMASGFKQACQRKVAFHSTGAIKARGSFGIPCDLVTVDSGRIDSLALALTKRSQFKGVLNYHLQKFKGVGIMSRLISRYYSQLNPLENKFVPVRIWGIVMVLSILGGGAILSLLILVVEIMMHRNEVKRGVLSDQNDTIKMTHTSEAYMKEQFLKY